ncbi:cutinase family protein [Skermania sp. ID1734]|uniref:cutinase family protein n=1 Tax=Skermania sp. ID1734 TaxID=2597516 RepID=UPI00117FFA05|nr:cutinase family protein [Skermania sp. ID1734]TSE01462.1 cutinase family protein [Skermania sp. ID1734]
MRYRIALLATTLIAAFVCGIESSAVSPVAHAAACDKQIVVLGAEGSGERAGGPPGLGPEVGFAVADIRNRLEPQGIQVSATALDYPANAVESLKSEQGVRDFLAGIGSGVSNAIQDIAAIDRQLGSCPGARIVLAGYSQGAMVMHRVLDQLHGPGPNANPRFLDRIAAVLLIADGDKVPGDTDHLYPAAQTATTSGISTSVAPISGATTTAFPADVRDRVFSVCLVGDPVCDFQPSEVPDIAAVAMGGQSNGARIHGEMYKTSTWGATAPLVQHILSVR